MATSGAKFLKLTKAATLTVSGHARDRLHQYAGFSVTAGLAETLFRGSRHVKYEQLRMLGYRPGYFQRQRDGVRSWYFLFRVFGQELVAVISEGEEANEYVWVTTYAPNRQMESYRVADWALLEGAAA